jgi:hypothetical protein
VKAKIKKVLRPATRTVFLSYAPDEKSPARRCWDAFRQKLEALFNDLNDVPLKTVGTHTILEPGAAMKAETDDLWRNVTDFLAVLTSDYLKSNSCRVSDGVSCGELARAIGLKELERRGEDDVLTIWFAPAERLNLRGARLGGCNPTIPPSSAWWHRLRNDDDRFMTEPDRLEVLQDQVFVAVNTVLSHPNECHVCVGSSGRP